MQTVKLVRYGETLGECLQTIGKAVACPLRKTYVMTFNNRAEADVANKTAFHIKDSMGLKISINYNSNVRDEVYQVQIHSEYEMGIMVNGEFLKVKPLPEVVMGTVIMRSRD